MLGIKLLLVLGISIVNSHLTNYLWLKTKYKSVSVNKWIKLMVLALILLWIHPLLIVLILLYLLWPSIQKFRLKKRRSRVLSFYGYKIFKYILNQLSSNIYVSDTIQSLYMVVDDHELRQTLIDLSAHYVQTSNLEEALSILKRTYKGLEIDTLCVAIEQGIKTGTNFETLVRMEELLFKKYIYQIKRETELKRKRGIISVMLLCTVIVLMIAIPVIMDIILAFNQIFY